jgi:hypothetical protein
MAGVAAERLRVATGASVSEVAESIREVLQQNRARAAGLDLLRFQGGLPLIGADELGTEAACEQSEVQRVREGTSSASSAWTRLSISSRIARTSCKLFPAGSVSSQSTYRLPG